MSTRVRRIRFGTVESGVSTTAFTARPISCVFLDNRHAGLPWTSLEKIAQGIFNRWPGRSAFSPFSTSRLAS